MVLSLLQHHAEKNVDTLLDLITKALSVSLCFF